jgi:EAL domain-containing protein (putative c-di-GMP-specific phosphodiesterase class I)
MPGAFIPPASRLGLMPAIDTAILEQVTALLERDPMLRIAINLDAASFDDDAVLDRLEHVLTSSYGLTGRLGIEITEHTSLRSPKRAERRLRRLQELGCDVAIDDFGTGFASFDHLRNLPANLVKISHNFIANLDTDPTARALVQAIVTVAHALGKQVIAEGVERPEIAELLRALDIEYAQGYLFGRPILPTSTRETRILLGARDGLSPLEDLDEHLQPPPLRGRLAAGATKSS